MIISQRNPNEISLFDALVFLARYWVPIFVVPVVVAGGAYAYAHSFPPTFTANCTLDLSALPEEIRITPAYRTALAAPGVSVSQRGRLLTFKATAESPAAAKSAVEVAHQSAAAEIIEQVRELAARIKSVEERALAAGSKLQGSAAAMAAASLQPAITPLQERRTVLEFMSVELANHPAVITEQYDKPAELWAVIALIVSGAVGLAGSLLRHIWMLANSDDARS